MCGIWFELFNNEESRDIIEENIVKYSEILSHRGPDSTGSVIIDDKICLLHTRLQINGGDTKQPLYDKENDVYLIINGEIFNWKELEEELNYKCESSDCEIILPLYSKYRYNLKSMFQKLNGQFSFVLVDVKNKSILISRDRIGVTPLYMGYSSNSLVVASELKAIPNNMTPKVFEPRKYMHFSYEKPQDFSTITQEHWITFDNIHGYLEPDLTKINQLLTESVRLQLKDLINNPNCKFGVLLSGGLDSSLIASLVVQLAKEMGYTKKIKTFSIGMSPDAPDLLAAKKVAEFLDTNHHEHIFDFETGINSVPNVINCIESYDCTSVRASTPMYLLTKYIKEKYPKIKVLFSGELSDELLCYLYGSNAPNDHDFQKETIKLVSNVHLFDCLRANKTCMAHSIEVRVPFTDPFFVDYILNIDPIYKRFGENLRMEKKILRDSFKDYLPDEILYRKKEQFSDGVSSINPSQNWILCIQDYTNNLYNDKHELIQKYTINTPRNNEELHYREIFSKFFDKNCDQLVKVWEPNWTNNYDPSGRVQSFWIFRRGI
jgi:asparagine synthase (glutamine-hydrolysing)